MVTPNKIIYFYIQESSKKMKVETDPFDINLSIETETQEFEGVQPEVVDISEEEEDDVDLTPPHKEDVAVDDSDEVEFEGRTGSSLMAQSYKNKGLLSEDFEVKDDLTSTELFDALYQTAQSRAVEDAEQKILEKGYSDQALEYAEFIAQGGNPQVVQQHNIYDRLAEYQPQTDDDHKGLIRAMLQDKQMDEDLIEDTLETLEVNDKLETKSEQAKAYFSQKRDAFFNYQKEQLTVQREEHQKSIKAQEDSFRKLINRGQIGDLTLSKTEAKELERAFLERTEVVVQEAQDGKKQKIKITRFEKMMGDIRQDPEKTLQFAYMVLNGVSNVKQKAKTEAREEFLSVLDAKKKIETVRAPQTPTRNKTVFQDFADTQPIIMKY